MLLKNYFFILLLLLTVFIPSSAQNFNELQKTQEELNTRGEIYFSFIIPPAYSLSWLSEQLSIDRVKGDSLFAYANEKQFEKFLLTGISFTLLTPPSLLLKEFPSFKTTLEEPWQSYPTYFQYIEMMENFTMNYPEICYLTEIGRSIGGKKILAVKISDNVEVDETEPGVFYSSTIHGDEPSGFVLMLRLIDHLLKNHNIDERITFLINNAEIYINPLANPDGLYFVSDTSVFGAKRGNLNNIDLNRDFPDPETGFRAVIQPETQYMMDFMKQRKFVLSANFHSGAEVINYPWDTWARKHADDEWYITLSREYVDTVQKYAPSGYMTDLDNGITNGYNWYEVQGGRQDYVNYYLFGREVTIEISGNKFPEGIALEQLWLYNKNSLVNYLFNCFRGIKGTVYDVVTAKPIGAEIFIQNHDFDNSHVFSDSASGVFYRMLSKGNYNLMVSSNGYRPKSLNVYVPYNGQTELSIGLEPVGLEYIVYPNPFADILNLTVPENISGEIMIELSDISGKVVFNKKFISSVPVNVQFETDFSGYGIYILKVTSDSVNKTFKVIKAPLIQ